MAKEKFERSKPHVNIGTIGGGVADCDYLEGAAFTFQALSPSPPTGGRDLTSSPNGDNKQTIGGILGAIIASMTVFSICAGPTRLTDANDEEMKIIPINSFLVSWAATALFWNFS